MLDRIKISWFLKLNILIIQIFKFFAPKNISKRNECKSEGVISGEYDGE